MTCFSPAQLYRDCTNLHRILEQKVSCHQLITYEELGEELGLPPNCDELSTAMLFELFFSLLGGLPNKVAIIISIRTGLPGKKFFEILTELGILEKDISWRKYWVEELEKLGIDIDSEYKRLSVKYQT